MTDGSMLAAALVLFPLLASCSAPAPRDPTKPEPAATEPATTQPAATQPAAPRERRWTILDGEEPILDVSSVPGLLISTAPPPPGPSTPATHPFLSATARSPIHEHRLRQILLSSTSLEDFLARLQAAGFTVREE